VDQELCAIVRGTGRLRIAHGRGRLARLLARLLRLPRAGDDVDAHLVVTSHAGGEQWRRTFGARRLNTQQYESGDHELAERFGLLELRFRLEASAGSLVYRHVESALRMGALRLPLPALCAPAVEAREDPASARQVRVRIGVTLPGVGPILAYDGVIDFEGGAA
jgi:hypothetical protein